MIPSSHLFDQSTIAALLEHDPVVLLSARFAGCCNVASRARAPKQKKGEQGLGQEAARILREKRRAAKAPRLFRRGLSVVLLS